MSNQTIEQASKQVAAEQRAERVERGAALLDERRLGWDEFTDLDRLDMASHTNDVLGQEYGSYSVGVRKLFPADSPYSFGFNAPFARAHGFDVEVGADADAYAALTVAWRELIEARKAGVR